VWRERGKLLLGGVDARENENGLGEFLHGIKQIHIAHGLGNQL
jgi:hypothetical protein